jgi:ribosomal protein S18 acetylase RimI-like enzyme
MKNGYGNIVNKKGGKKMQVMRYKEKYKQDFIDLNKRWFEKFFKIEPHDLEQLKNVETYIEQGGMIFFAIEDDHVLSTCMVTELQPKVWEICKFATNEKFQGRGAGKIVFTEAINYAKEQGAKKIVIYSNKNLKTALHIYQLFGFNEVPVDIDDYERCDYQAELLLNE